MSELRQVQAMFWGAVSADPGESSAAAELMSLIEPSPTQQPDERLQVYVNAYYWRLLQVLRETFPRLAEMLDTQLFATLVHDYLAAHPSQHPSVSYVGGRFADFLGRRDDVPPYAAELAQLEWTRGMVFEAADATPIAVDALRQIAPESWPEARFTTVPALQVMRCAWPVQRLWSDPGAAIDAEATTLRVWRGAEWKVVHAAMSEREAAALQRLRDGQPFAAICEVFADLDDEQAPRDAMGWLLRWLEDGLIAGVDVRSTAAGADARNEG